MSVSATASVTASAFTSALSNAANGVSIVTTTYRETPAGLTVSSICSVCAEPALMLACVNADNEFCESAMRSESFAVNILTTGSVELAKVFAGLTDDSNDQRFESGEWTTLSSGAPILANALVALDCLLDSTLIKGTHRVFFGKVVDLRTTGGEPLLYTNRRFAQVSVDDIDG